jgi:rhodanese-related sulfurtransferase
LGTHEQVAGLFRDPRYSQGLVVFLDARDDKHYQAGHIPAAYQFNHYRLQDHVQEVLPACQVAQQIVVYCNGGECEDSEFAAADLIQLGIANEKITVYGGGLTEWNKQGMAIETGPRGSGNIVEPNGK